jgi:hypothetical protein
MDQVVNCQALAMEACVQSRASPCENCGGQSNTGTGFSLSTFVVSCHYCSTNAPYLFVLLLLTL